MTSGPPERSTGSGILLGLTSAGSFGLSGSLARSLFDSGWSPGAAVTVRITLAATILAVPGVRSMRGRWHLLRSNVVPVMLFGLLAVAGAQLFFFNAVQTLSVGVALMLEYMGLVLVVLWQWAKGRRRPSRSTAMGVVLALAGLFIVLDVVGSAQVDLVGVLWGLAAATGLAGYFIIAGDDRSDIPPIAMASAGMIVGGLVLVLASVAGVIPMRVTGDEVELVGAVVPVFVAVGGLGLITGAIAYASGVVAARRLGPTLGVFLGLTEVLFAVFFAWLLLDQLPRPVQLVGGMLILIGVAIVRREQTSVDAIGAEAIPDGPDTVPMDHCAK